MFQLCDHDQDGCMNPVHILQMLQRLERVFVRETARVEVQSEIMLRKIADNKAELNFHFIMEAIKQENIKRAHDRLKDQKDNESKNKSASNSGALGTGGSPEKKSSSAATSIEPVNITDDYLVTYREFMSALQREFKQGLRVMKKTTLAKTLLPRTLAFVDVLQSEPEEKIYEVSDVNLDDFYMFRYELSSVFQQHLFKKDRGNDFELLGTNPLSQCQGLPVKDMVEHLSKNEENLKHKKEAEQLMLQC